MNESGSSILVVDGDKTSRSLVVDLLSCAGFTVRGERSGEAAMVSVRGESPSAVLLEVRLPGLSGYEICHQLRDELGDRVAIMLMSGERTEPFDRAAGLLVGADDYVVKPFASDELLARVRALLRRLPPDASTGGAGDLTKRELEVLRLLADGLEPSEIAVRLVISPKTVSGHVEAILKKLQVHSRAQAVARAYKDGFVRL